MPFCNELKRKAPDSLPLPVSGLGRLHRIQDGGTIIQSSEILFLIEQNGLWPPVSLDRAAEGVKNPEIEPAIIIIIICLLYTSPSPRDS